MGDPHSLKDTDKPPSTTVMPTSCGVISHWLEEVKGGCGAIYHGQELPDAVGVWRAHPAQLPVERCLQVPTLAPQQRRNVPGGDTTTTTCSLSYTDTQTALDQKNKTLSAWVNHSP